MHRHDWNVSVAEAKSIQERLSQKIVVRDRFRKVQYVAGTDVGINLGKQTACGVVAILDFPSLKVVDHAHAYEPITFPYIPGFLSFREAPVLIKAFERLSIVPDLILCDGQGIAHPRSFGLACHIGLLTGIPAIGVAKSRLIGTYKQPDLRKGSTSTLFHHGEQVGTVLRSRESVSPIFISPGNGVSFDSAVNYSLNCCTRYRLPETTRQAHKLAVQLSAKLSDSGA